MFENFKNLIRKGDKFIFVEDGKPAYVVMHYEDYEGMIVRRSLDEGGLTRNPVAPSALRAAAAEAPRREVHASSQQDFSGRLVMDASNVPEDISKIRLEDLPL